MNCRGGPAEVKLWELTVPGLHGPGPEAVAAAHAQASATALGPGFALPFLRVDLAVEVPRNF